MRRWLYPAWLRAGLQTLILCSPRSAFLLLPHLGCAPEVVPHGIIDATPQRACLLPMASTPGPAAADSPAAPPFPPLPVPVPAGPKTLCNACGVKRTRKLRAEQEGAKRRKTSGGASPSPSPLKPYSKLPPKAPASYSPGEAQHCCSAFCGPLPMPGWPWLCRKPYS